MKLGFIGCGNMASAMMGGIIKNHIFKADEIIGADLYAPSKEKVKSTLGIHIAESNRELVEKSEVVVLSVKPQYYESVITEIKDL
ncbi:MAG: NAD(P)-binding domain-containing protein, partial [Lachnospiraceae bacterium]